MWRAFFIFMLVNTSCSLWLAIKIGGPDCGDGVQGPDEECDDGNENSGDSCTNDCAVGFCGDGQLQTGVEQCDDGNVVFGDGCRSDCISERCGDSLRDPQEACDDGNVLSGDGCRSDCLGEEVCGDGFLDSGEACDDGNNQNGDSCSSDCSASLGSARFQYVLLAKDDNGSLVAGGTCNDAEFPAPIQFARFIIGNDLDGDGFLDDLEILQDILTFCNQFDQNGDGFIQESDFGEFFGVNLPANTFDLFAIEFWDLDDNPVSWKVFDSNAESTRFTFGGEITIPSNDTALIFFDGDFQQVGSELQVFLE